MSTLYLLDAHDTTAANSRITDVQVDPNGAENPVTGATINGSFPVFVPPGIAVEQVSTVTELNTAKFTDLLALYPGFEYIAYDDLVSSPNYDPSALLAVQVGDRVSVKMMPGGIYQTNAISLSDTPNDAIVIWEVYEIVETISDNRVLLTLNELDPDTTDMEVRASFNGGTNFQLYTNGVMGVIPPAEQGSSLVMKFNNISDFAYLASWAVLY